ncbi:MAG: SAM-dependent methyltransferase [Lentisphaeria bacterium]|nr:SAM-dependent methyltransferase [Lentisphaeria bacterium]
MSGHLIMASTCLGLPDDIPERTAKYAKEADLVVFEERRPARQVLKKAGVHREFLCYNEQHQQSTLNEVRASLLSNKTVMYCSDQGCPTLEDPGRPLLKLAYSVNAKISVIPGPSSLTAALSACPFETKQFQFLGFLPRETKQRLKALRKVAANNSMQIIMDTPYRLQALLESCNQTLGDRSLMLALDISGKQEQFLIASAKILINKTAQYKKLNFVLVVAPQ